MKAVRSNTRIFITISSLFNVLFLYTLASGKEWQRLGIICLTLWALTLVISKIEKPKLREPYWWLPF